MKPWFRGDEDPAEVFGDLDEIAWYEGQAQSAAHKLFKHIHSLEELNDEDFFVVNPVPKVTAGGDSTLKSSLKRVLASGQDQYSDRQYIVDSGVSFHLVAADSLTPKEKGTLVKVTAIPITTANGEIVVDTMVKVHVRKFVIYV